MTLLVASNPNVLQSMQGRVAGVNVDTDGVPGQGTRVKVRGISTLGNNDPLYIVDGVPIHPKKILRPLSSISDSGPAS